MSVLKRLGGTFDFDTKSERLVEVSRELEDSAVWDDPENAQALGRERATLEAVVETILALESGLSDAQELLDIAVEEQDEDTVAEVESELSTLECSA